MLMLFKKKQMNVQPTLEAFWSSNIMMAVVHVADGDTVKKIVVANYYRPPHCHYLSMSHLGMLLVSLKERHKSSCIIVSGDFNMAQVRRHDNNQ